MSKKRIGTLVAFLQFVLSSCTGWICYRDFNAGIHVAPARVTDRALYDFWWFIGPVAVLLGLSVWGIGWLGWKAGGDYNRPSHLQLGTTLLFAAGALHLAYLMRLEPLKEYAGMFIFIFVGILEPIAYAIAASMVGAFVTAGFWLSASSQLKR